MVGGHRMAGARVVDLEQDQPRLHPHQVERADAGRPDAVAGAGREERVPGRLGGRGRDPQLVAQVARVAGSRDVDLDPGERRAAAPEVGDVRPPLAGRRLQHRPGPRPLQGQCGDGLGDVLDLHVQAAAFIRSQRYCGSAAVQRSRSSSRRAIVPSSITFPRSSHHGVYITWPGCSRVASRVITRSARRAASGPEIRYLQSGETSKTAAAWRIGVVLDVVEVGVAGGRVIAGPVAPGELAVERRGALVERGADARCWLRTLSQASSMAPPWRSTTTRS